MFMVCRYSIFRIGLKGGILLTTFVFGLALEVLAIASAETTLPINPSAPVPPLILSGRQSDRPAGTYSAGVTEIVRMLEAKVDAPVILAYIQNSTIPYNPDATELIALKEHGASTEILTAMLHRGDELRLQLAQAQSAVNPPAPAPAYDDAPEAAYPAAAYPDSLEVPYPATVYTYVSGWPWGCGTTVCNRYRPYWYERGRWYAHRGDAHPVGEGGQEDRASATSPTVPAPHLVSTPSSGRTGILAAHSSGGRGSGRSGGWSGGRSR